MNVHDWLTGASILLMTAIVGWTVYQNVMLKKDVTILSTIKEVEALWKAVNDILEGLGVDNIDDALHEIGLLKGTEPTPQKEAEAWIPPVEPVEKK